jgi:hypothetical protein
MSIATEDTDYFVIKEPTQPNHTWQIAEDFCICSTTKKTWYNRFKWWIATKLVLPGTYKWN